MSAAWLVFIHLVKRWKSVVTPLLNKSNDLQQPCSLDFCFGCIDLELEIQHLLSLFICSCAAPLPLNLFVCKLELA